MKKAIASNLKISPPALLINSSINLQKLYSDFQLSEIHPTFALRVRHLLYAGEPLHRSGSPSALCPLPSAFCLNTKGFVSYGSVTAISPGS